MTEFAETIEISDKSVKINGEEFPFYLAKGGVVVGAQGGMETLTLTLLTGREAPAESSAANGPKVALDESGVEEVVKRMQRHQARQARRA